MQFSRVNYDRAWQAHSVVIPLSGVWTFLPTVPFLLHRGEFH